MTSYLIIDDEHIAHDIIKGYCDALPNLKLVGHCYDAIEAMECLRRNKVDLIFLDLNMPKLKGFEFLKIFRIKFIDLEFKYLSLSFKISISSYRRKSLILVSILIS